MPAIPFSTSTLATRLTAAAIVAGAVGVTVTGMSLYGSSSYNAALADTNSIRQGAIFGSIAKANAGTAVGKQTAYALAVHQNGAAAASDSAPSRAAFLKAVEATDGAFAKMPVDILSKEEATKFSAAQEAWSQFKAADKEIQAGYAKGDDASIKAADALLSGTVAEASGAIASNLGGIIGSVNKRVSSIEGNAKSANASLQVTQIIAAIIGTLLLAALSTLAIRRLRHGLANVETALHSLADGALNAHAEEDGNDEVTALAHGVNSTADSLRALVNDVTSSALRVDDSAKELVETASNTDQAALATSTSLESARQHSDSVSGTISSVATGTDEMSESIDEIAQNVQNAASVSAEAVDITAQAHGIITQLAESSQEIGNVISVITGIAEQTNLLALNATIESARAGEAGKGFAVVATEVKELAEETARSTEAISQTVGSIQGDTDQAMNSINQITDIIRTVSETQTAIASAVEEQTATTREMARSVGDSANGASLVATALGEANSKSSVSKEMSERSKHAASSLRGEAERLRTCVGRFTF